MTTVHPFDAATLAPPDPIAGLTERFVADARPQKINLGVGVYLDANGRIPILRAVHAARQALLDEGAASNYLPIDGLAGYNAAVQRLVLGEQGAAALAAHTVCVQAPGGTGALRLAADLAHRLLGPCGAFVSTPTWANHHGVLQAAGLPVSAYPYYDADTRGVDETGLIHALDTAPQGSLVLLHACCHNPTGADLTTRQWSAVARVLRERGHVALLDMAYQGFADGLEADAAPARLLADAGVPLLIASSFSKNLSLYGERVGALTVVGADADQAARLRSELKQLVRANYSNPPLHGAAVALKVLGDAELSAQWRGELGEMRERVAGMRRALAAALRERGCGDRFGFITGQRGMFSFLGISKQQVARLRDEHAIYALDNGRACIAALHPGNVERVADALAAVVREDIAVSA